MLPMWGMEMSMRMTKNLSHSAAHFWNTPTTPSMNPVVEVKIASRRFGSFHIYARCLDGAVM